MPQQPTGATPVEILKEYKGLNDQVDSLKRPPGTITEGKNLFDSNYGDANRRQGRDLQSLDPDGNPISVIYSLTWADGSAFQVSQTGGNFAYNPATYPVSSTVSSLLTDPCPDGLDPIPLDPTTSQPLCPPPNPSGGLRMPPTGPSVIGMIPDFVPLIRAMAEAYYFSQKSSAVLNVPDQKVAVDFIDKNGNIVAPGIRDRDSFEGYLSDGLKYRISSVSPISPALPLTSMPLDFYYVDYVVRGSSRYISDLDALIITYNSQVLQSYLKTDPSTAPATLSNYGVPDYFIASVSELNFQQVCSQFANKVNTQLVNVKVPGVQGSFQTKMVTKQDSASATCSSNTPTTVTISGYDENMFGDVGSFPFGDPCFSIASGNPSWDGSMTHLSEFDDCAWLNLDSSFNVVTSIQNHGCNAGAGFNVDRYQLVIELVGMTGGATLWSGEKLTGSDPLGVYNQTSGCVAIPSSITLV